MENCTADFRSPGAFTRPMMSLPFFSLTRMLNMDKEIPSFRGGEKTHPQPLKYQIMSKLWEGFRCCRLWLYIHIQLANILGSILKLSFDPLRTSYPLGSGLTQYWKCQDSSCSESNLDKFSQEQLFRQYFKLI